MANEYEGFVPSNAQWNSICLWQLNHERKWHLRPTQEVMTKYIPNEPEYRYEFEFLAPLDGKCGYVTCLTCARKAFRRSFGSNWLYDRLCEKYDAKYKFGEL